MQQIEIFTMHLDYRTLKILYNNQNKSNHISKIILTWRNFFSLLKNFDFWRLQRCLREIFGRRMRIGNAVIGKKKLFKRKRKLMH